MRLNGNHKIEKNLSLHLRKPEKAAREGWRELKSFHKEFQSILSLLIRHDKESEKRSKLALTHAQSNLRV